MNTYQAIIGTCRARNLRKRNPHYDDESWSWRGSDLPKQGYVNGQKVTQWQTLQRDTPGAPVMYAPLEQAPIYRSSRCDMGVGSHLAISFAQLPTPVKDEYYMRLHLFVDDTSPKDVWLTALLQTVPESPYTLLKLEYTMAGTTGRPMKWRLTYTDAEWGTDPEVWNKGQHVIPIEWDSSRANSGATMRFFFDSTGITWNISPGSNLTVIASGRNTTGFPLYKPKTTVGMYLNWDGMTTESQGYTRWYNIGLGVDIDTAPPYP